MPEKHKGDYEQPTGSEAGAPPISPRPQNIQFSDDPQSQQPRQMEHHELNPFGASNSSNPFKQNENGGDASGHGQETSFMGDYESGYQRSDNYLNRYRFAFECTSFE